MWHSAYVKVKGQVRGVRSLLLPLYRLWRTIQMARIVRQILLSGQSQQPSACVWYVYVFVASLCIPDWPWTCSNSPASTLQVLKLGAFSLTSWGNGKGTDNNWFKGFKFRIVGTMVVLPTFWSQFHQEDRVIACKEWVSNPFFRLPVSFHSDLLTPDALMQAYWHYLWKHTSSFTSALLLLCWLQNDFTSHVRWYS